jgi:hypothetical protein
MCNLYSTTTNQAAISALFTRYRSSGAVPIKKTARPREKFMPWVPACAVP